MDSAVTLAAKGSRSTLRWKGYCYAHRWLYKMQVGLVLVSWAAHIFQTISTLASEVDKNKIMFRNQEYYHKNLDVHNTCPISPAWVMWRFDILWTVIACQLILWLTLPPPIEPYLRNSTHVFTLSLLLIPSSSPSSFDGVLDVKATATWNIVYEPRQHAHIYP